MNDSPVHPYGTSVAPSSALQRKRLILICFSIYWIPLVLNGFYNPFLMDFPWLFWIVDLITHFVSPVALLAILHFSSLSIYRMGFSSLIAGKRRPFLLVALPIPLAALLWVALRAGDRVFPYLVTDPYSLAVFFYADVLPKTPLAKTVIAAYFSLSAGFFEEIFFRSLLSRVFGVRWFYYLASASLFAAVHWKYGTYFIASTLMWAVLVAFLFVKLRNLWVLAIAHSLVDFGIFLFNI
jgi:membrane protease YdiL (CAAX protease family)